MGSFTQALYTSVEDLGFRTYTDEDIKRLSVLKVTNDQAITELGHMAVDGLYDLRMGPMFPRSRELCQTCHQDGSGCLGHSGHIELPLPVFNPVFYDVIKSLLMRVCWTCYQFQASEAKVMLFNYQMQLLDEGYGQEAHQLASIAALKFDESEEMSLDAEEKEVSGLLGTSKLCAMKKSMEQYVKKVLEGGTSCQETSTSYVKAIRDQIAKNFLDSSRPKTVCQFCRSRVFRLAHQNSRLMIANPLSAKGKKSKSEKFDEEEEAEEEEKEKSAGKLDVTASIVSESQSYITPYQAQSILQRCWKNSSDILKTLYPLLRNSTLENPTDIFFIHTLLVIPPKYRPCDKQNGRLIENEATLLYKNVIKMAKSLKFLLSLVSSPDMKLPPTIQLILKEIRGNTPQEKSQTVWSQMQASVDSILDSELTSSGNDNNLNQKGVKQVIEKKFGLFRRNLMGKRVNYSARSVAAPDPLLAVDEVGVPMDFATRLSYPVPVTKWNVEELRQLIINGPNVYPGALHVEDETGRKQHLSPTDRNSRIAVAKQLLTPKESHVTKINASKIVYRHLKNGDYVLMNRQPTLHRPSIQAHRARVMPKDRVMRMPYANCKAYNADFDGDELNMHFPQNEMARSEARYIVTCQNQYLTPKNGTPLAGLIQDCVVSSVMLTTRGMFFSQEDYQQLLYVSLMDHTREIKMLPPAIYKPQKLWSGKQIISSLLLNIIQSGTAKPTFNFKTTVKVDMWQKVPPRQWKAGGPPEKKREALTESEFIMREGELLCGVIDKSAIGSTTHGLVHTCYDLYGGRVATEVLTAINRLSVYYLQWVGHTISVKEFITPGNVSRTRRKRLASLVKRAPAEVARKLGVSEEEFREHFESSHMSANDKAMAAIDAAYTSVLGPTTSEVTGDNERGLYRHSLDNHMRMMVDTGSKGSKVNMNQMASLFGSVAIDGKRMPLSITGKTLPSFKAYEPNPRSGGYIPHRFMTGMDPQAYFFLCIVGRDSLQHTAVKTADSGYVQRCLIKHLEGIHVKYDNTVRNSDGLVLQFGYGEDGQDVTKIPFLKDLSTIDVLVDNFSKILDEKSLSIARSVGDKEEVNQHNEKLRKWRKKNGKSDARRISGFLKFSKKTSKTMENTGYRTEIGRSNVALELQNMWHNLSPEKKEKYEKGNSRCPDPTNSLFSGASNLGVVSEALESLIDEYYESRYSKRPVKEQKLTREEVATTIHMKALLSKVDPGEAVGALCAQALGEPLTQMTLNTFHFAGRDELNVTLGVPRMGEILRTATKNLLTPIMEVPFRSHITRAQAEALKIALTEVALAKVLSKMFVSMQLVRDSGGTIVRKTKIRFSFLPYRSYKNTYATNPTTVLKQVEQKFIPKMLLREIYKSFNIKKKAWVASASGTDDVNNEEEEDGDEDPLVDKAPTIKKKPKASPQSDNEEDLSEEEEEAVADEGASSSVRNSKAKEQDYSENEEDVAEDVEVKDEQGLDEDDERQRKGEENSEEEEEAEDTRMLRKRKKPVSDMELSRRREWLLQEDAWIVDYNFDQENELWCEVTLHIPVSGGNYDIPTIIRQKSKQFLVHAIHGIRRVFVVEKDDKLLLKTEGVNMFKMCEYEHMLDINRLYTNNIHTVAETYGIEAAQRSIIREIRAVQSAYDIQVDFRHLSLLADYFTCEGVYKACSRHALSSCTSPLQKMSYETCMHFLKAALVQGEKDRMTSPTSSVTLGQTVKVGTNVMHILPVLKV